MRCQQNPDLAPPVRFAGDAYQGYLLVDSITRNQYGSLLVSVGMVFPFVWWILRFPSTALLAVLPIFSVITLRMGVDLPLHWLVRLRLASKKTPDWETAIRKIGRNIGGAILLNGLVLLFEFGRTSEPGAGFAGVRRLDHGLPTACQGWP
jgi:predicted RND superfamily exporter protein